MRDSWPNQSPGQDSYIDVLPYWAAVAGVVVGGIWYCWYIRRPEVAPPPKQPGQHQDKPKAAGTGIAVSSLLPPVLEKIRSLAGTRTKAWEGHARAMEHWLQFRQRSWRTCSCSDPLPYSVQPLTHLPQPMHSAH